MRKKVDIYYDEDNNVKNIHLEYTAYSDGFRTRGFREIIKASKKEVEEISIDGVSHQLEQIDGIVKVRDFSVGADAELVDSKYTLTYTN